jgi:hypothetical protein
MDWVEGDGAPSDGATPPGQAFYGAAPQGNGLEDRLEQWVSRGRELVDGVAGTRPGGRPIARGAGRGPSRRRDGLGRWVEGKLDWLLDDRDDWREPWEADRPVAPPPTGVEPSARRPRPPLEALSRRGSTAARQPTPAPRREGPEQQPGPKQQPQPEQQHWPEEEAFTVPRWRRQEPPPPPPVDPLAAAPPPAPPSRPLPRSTRRR